MQLVRNYEVGFKFQNDLFYADISAYFRDFTGLQYTPTDANGAQIPDATLIYGSESKGVNFIGALTPGEHFRFEVVANYLDGEYTDYDACVPYTNVVTGNGCAPIEGQQLQRQPKLRYMLTPSYRLPIGSGDLSAYVTYTHVGDHTQDQSGLQQLGTYETWDFGITANLGEQLAVFPARHQRERRARPHRKQLAHLRPGRRHRWCAAGAAAGRPRDQFPGEVPLVMPRYTVLQSCAALDSSASALERPNGSMR